MGGESDRSRDVDSAGVYYMSIEDFEARPRAKRALLYARALDRLKAWLRRLRARSRARRV